MNSLIRLEGLTMVAAGNGLLQEPITKEAIELSGAEKPEVLIIGTAKATPDEFGQFVMKATDHFEALGASVVNLHDFDQAPSAQEATDKIEQADMLWVGGGDTLKMVDFWREHALDLKIGKVAASGTVMSGGSAGMLAWFKQAHSDSMSYRVKKIGDEWENIFVPGLDYIDAVGCPHYDSINKSKTAKTAPLRSTDFKNMFLADNSLPNIGIGITNRAALAIHQGEYRVVAVPHDEKPAEVHILIKTEDGLTDEQLPIDSDYQPFDL